jgi:hypothetical protein
MTIKECNGRGKRKKRKKRKERRKKTEADVLYRRKRLWLSWRSSRLHLVRFAIQVLDFPALREAEVMEKFKVTHYRETAQGDSYLSE